MTNAEKNRTKCRTHCKICVGNGWILAVDGEVKRKIDCPNCHMTNAEKIRNSALSQMREMDKEADLAEAEHDLWHAMNAYERLAGREALKDFFKEWPLNTMRKPF